jgi:hypothetical protein
MQVIETLKNMMADKEAHRAEYVESGPVAQGYCDGYRSGVQDAKLLLEGEECEAVELLRKWSKAFNSYGLTCRPGDMATGRLAADTGKFLREVS